MTIRPVNLETDYPMLKSWWEGHGAPILPAQVFLPGEGWVAEDGMLLAASWLFVAPNTQGGVGMIEFTTTNPTLRTRKVLAAVKALYAKLETRAQELGCGSITALAAQNQGISHLLGKLGYMELGDGAHTIHGKALWDSSR